jgi:hypothetical protein
MSYWVYLEDPKAKPYCNYGSGEEEACSAPCYPAAAKRRPARPPVTLPLKLRTTRKAVPTLWEAFPPPSSM